MSGRRKSSREPKSTVAYADYKAKLKEEAEEKVPSTNSFFQTLCALKLSPKDVSLFQRGPRRQEGDPSEDRRRKIREALHLESGGVMGCALCIASLVHVRDVLTILVRYFEEWKKQKDRLGETVFYLSSLNCFLSSFPKEQLIGNDESSKFMKLINESTLCLLCLV